MVAGQGLIMGVRGVAGVCGGTALVTALVTVTKPPDRSEKETGIQTLYFFHCLNEHFTQLSVLKETFWIKSFR